MIRVREPDPVRELEEMRHNFTLVSDLYDDVLRRMPQEGLKRFRLNS